MRHLSWSVNFGFMLLGASAMVLGGMATRSPQAAVQAQSAQLLSASGASLDPRRIISVKEGEAYVVPSGKRFVLAGLGSTNPTVASVLLQVDGAAEISTHTETPTTIRETPSWFSVAPGRTISVGGGDGTLDARVFGYLINE
jgi:hypothetical protein